ncbi:MAG TPA: T9SS type A sorting domain-containing protein [Prolixibacteraceae bacterium]|nr:T9SS type A sorting domain-containing protein [Prolixibacteraceae bacterium]
MKPNYAYIVLMLISICLSFSLNTHGQIIVEAGNDTTYCSGVYTTEIPMGLKVKIQNGIEPYTYAWECKIPKGNYSFYTASDFLNDTTAISPSFTYPPANNQWVTFTLHVTDSENNSGKDSIRFRFSKFGYLLGYPGVEINKGDSILLSFSSIGGGIEPLKFHYQPETGLSNPDSLVTWAKPEVSTTYDIIATDSCGCVSEPNTAYYVMVMISQELPDHYMGKYSGILSNCSKNQLGQYDCVNTSNSSLRFVKTSNKSKIEVFFEDNSHFILTQKNDSTFTHSEFPYISAVFYDVDGVKLSRVHSSIGYSTYKGKRKTTANHENPENLKIKVSPNPAYATIRIELDKPEYQNLIISDQSGSKVNEYNLKNKQSLLIEMGNLPDGLYFISVYDKKGNTRTIKLILK